MTEIAKFRDPNNPGKWFLTDFTMEQVENFINNLETKLIKVKNVNKRSINKEDQK
jgi:hypothetical protein